MYEVEIKYPVASHGPLEAGLAALAARWHPLVVQTDRYFAHPCRDFAVTDEALRLRQDGDRAVITWKGPRIDATTKTRREIELPLLDAGPHGSAPAGTDPSPRTMSGVAGGTTLPGWTALLEALGFRPVATVTKRRRHAAVDWQGRSVTVVLDSVEGVGDYVELELQAAEEDVPAARSCLESLAHALGCGAAERRSYLELLLAARSGHSG